MATLCACGCDEPISDRNVSGFRRGHKQRLLARQGVLAAQRAAAEELARQNEPLQRPGVVGDQLDAAIQVAAWENRRGEEKTLFNICRHGTTVEATPGRPFIK